jgi:hypothetical protein
MKTRIIGFLLAAAVILLPGPAAGQEEAASRYYHYRTTEMSTGIYEEYEVRPRGGQSRFESREGSGIGISRIEEKDARAWNRYFLNDAHQDLRFYEYRRCVDCHGRNASNRHTVRYGITCRQCHGGEPIASVNHYYSRLNPIRQHTHVCAKCHTGATAAFAGYRIHEPNPADVATARTFPVLFYAFWVMIAIAVLTFAMFLPHTFVWVARELFAKGKKQEDK